MEIIIATISILAITALFWILNKFLPFKICPICAGVLGTWLWMLAGMFFGLLPTAHYQLPTAILMGGSVVGIAYQLEKRLPEKHSPLLWKTIFIPLGFIVVYSIISLSFTAFMPAIILLIAPALWFIIKPRRDITQNGKRVEELKNKMEDCC